MDNYDTVKWEKLKHTERIITCRAGTARFHITSYWMKGYYSVYSKRACLLKRCFSIGWLSVITYRFTVWSQMALCLSLFIEKSVNEAAVESAEQLVCFLLLLHVFGPSYLLEYWTTFTFPKNVMWLEWLFQFLVKPSGFARRKQMLYL